MPSCSREFIDLRELVDRVFNFAFCNVGGFEERLALAERELLGEGDKGFGILLSRSRLLESKTSESRLFEFWAADDLFRRWWVRELSMIEGGDIYAALCRFSKLG